MAPCGLLVSNSMVTVPYRRMSQMFRLHATARAETCPGGMLSTPSLPASTRASRPAHVRNIRMSASSLPYPEIPRSRDFPYRVQASFSRQVATFGLSTLVHSQRSRTQVSKTSLAVITLLYLSSRSAHGDVSRETSRAAYFDRYRPHLYLHQFDRHFILLCQ